MIRLVEHIKTHFTEQQIMGLRQRVTVAHDKTVNLTSDERARTRVACPLLGEDNACSVYPVRPLACRGWNSTNATLCKRAHNHPTEMVPLRYFAEQSRLGRSMQIGIERAMQEIGLRPGFVGLIPALHILLNDSDAADAWLSSRDVLENASAENRI